MSTFEDKILRKSLSCYKLSILTIICLSGIYLLAPKSITKWFIKFICFLYELIFM